RHTRSDRDWSSDVCSSDLPGAEPFQDRPRAEGELRFGDFVHKGQLLAVVWSKDLGEKKSELVEGIARLRIDEEKLENLQNGLKRSEERRVGKEGRAQRWQE